MKKFWNFVKITDQDPGSEAESFELRLEGPISEDSWWGDEVTPKMFRDELAQVSGNLTVWINSPGGDVFAGSQIYTMLREYSKGNITVKVDALAASAASVVAMAGDQVYMAPTALMMIHDPSTFAMGNESDMKEAIKVLKEVKESIINAYEAKTGRARDELARLMQDEGTWMNAKKAVELGFADGVLYTDGEGSDQIATAYKPHMVMNSLVEKIQAVKDEEPEKAPVEPVSPDPENVAKTPEAEDIEQKLKNETEFRMRLLGIRI